MNRRVSERQIEDRLNGYFEKATPDIWDRISARVAVTPQYMAPASKLQPAPKTGYARMIGTAAMVASICVVSVVFIKFALPNLHFFSTKGSTATTSATARVTPKSSKAGTPASTGLLNESSILSNRHVVSTTARTYIPMSNARSLYDQSSLVVIVTPTVDFDETVPSVVSGNMQYTIRNLKILKVIKGDLGADNFDIAENYLWTTDNYGEVSLVLTEDAIPMREGLKYILFLTMRQYPKGEYYSVIIENQGKFNIDGRDVDEKAVITNDWLELKADVLETYKSEISDILN